MSYSNPVFDTHGQPLKSHQNYRAYFSDGSSRRVQFFEDELCNQLIKFDGGGNVERYDELDVRSVVPLDAHGFDLPANEDPEELLRIELRADVAQIQRHQSQIDEILDQATARLSHHYGDSFDDRLTENLRTMMTAGSPADAIFEACTPIVDAASCGVPNESRTDPSAQRKRGQSPLVKRILDSDLTTNKTPAA